MSDCKLYDGITRAELAYLREYMAKQNVTVPEGDDVRIDAPFGVKLQVTFDEHKKTLNVCITEKPFYIPESQIWKMIDAGTAPYSG